MRNVSDIRNRKNPREERAEFLKNKDFTNAKTFLEWLILAGEAVEKNSCFIISRSNIITTDVTDKFREENVFIYEVLSSLQSPMFLEERMKQIKELGNKQEIEMINELQLIIKEKSGEIERIKKIVEGINYSNENIEINSMLLNLNAKADLKKKKRQLQIININSMNKKSNKIIIQEVKKILSSQKEKFLDVKNPEEEMLSKQIEQVLQQTDEVKLKEECERLHDELNNIRNIMDIDIHSIISKNINITLNKIDMISLAIRGYIKIYLDFWYTEEGVKIDPQWMNELEKEMESCFKAEKEKDELLEELNKLQAKVQAKEKELKKILEETEKKSEEILKEREDDAESTPSTPMTPGFPKDNEREEVTAQEWLEKIYGEDKEYVDEIDASKSNEKPIGELVIANYPILETINLKNMGITKLTVEECPNVEEITVHNNEITEIVGLENLAELKTLVCGRNQITKLDVSNNLQLVELTVFDNPNIQIVGLDSISKLEEFNGGGNNVLNLSQVSKESLEQAAKKLGIKEEKLKNKSSAEIKKLIEEEGNKIQRNKEKLNDKTVGFPGLLSKNGEVVDDKLVEIKKEVESIKKLKKEIKEVKKQIIIREVQIGEIEKELESKMGMDRLSNLKNKVQKKVQKKIEILEAKIQASDK